MASIKTESASGVAADLWTGRVPGARSVPSELNGARFSFKRAHPLTMATMDDQPDGALVELVDGTSGAILKLSRRELRELGLGALAMLTESRTHPVVINHGQKMELRQWIDGGIRTAIRELGPEAREVYAPFLGAITVDAIAAAPEPDGEETHPQNLGCAKDGCDGTGPKHDDDAESDVGG